MYSIAYMLDVEGPASSRTEECAAVFTSEVLASQRPQYYRYDIDFKDFKSV